MPVPVAAKVGIVVASVAVAAAIAIYEIPEVRRTADDLRRRIAIALQSLSDPNQQEPRFNRPEDAHGFYESHDVDADEETRRRQREEIMYWNMRREEQERERQRSQQPSRGSTFDDFLERDKTSESGTFVYNTGANAWENESSNVLRRRGNAEGVRGLNAAMLSNPFSDEYGIELEDRPEPLPPAREADVAMSDIYNATPLVRSSQPALPVQTVPVPAASEVLFDFASHNAPSEYGTAATSSDDHHQPATQPERAPTPTATTTTASRSATLDHELAEDEDMTAGQDDRTAADAYAAIQAWAQQTSSNNHNTDDHNNNNSTNINMPGFYSPLPHTPSVPISEPELVDVVDNDSSDDDDGQLTPTDSGSVAGSGVDVANEVVSVAGEEERRRRDYDVLSETDGGMPTPASWSEVGSVVSEGESLARA